jgi:hypothetical protein
LQAFIHIFSIFIFFSSHQRLITVHDSLVMVQGMAQGKDKANRENACRMKADGMGIELIAKYTG